MSKVWLLRPSPHGTNRMGEFVARSIIAIGWPELGDLTGMSREQIKAALATPPYSLSSLELGSAYASVDIFVNQMSVGDLVLVPNGSEIHFCRVVGDYGYSQSDQGDGYPHQRRVEWLATTLRTSLPMEVRLSLKVHRVTADLSEHFETIRAIVHGEPLPGAECNDVSGVVSVDYPLRPGVLVTVTVPRDITRTEAERLGDFVRTLFFA
ncbi:MAG: hypothetical protein DDT34_02252 [Firmicutes bacterium]|nr:hypothetical protein [Bacillota bacterium]